MLYRASSALSQTNTSVTTKADSGKPELQEKVMTSLPSMTRRSRFGALFMGFHLTALAGTLCKTLWAGEQS